MLPENIANARMEALKNTVFGDVRNQRGTAFIQSQREVANRLTPVAEVQQPLISSVANLALTGTSSSTPGSVSPPQTQLK